MNFLNDKMNIDYISWVEYEIVFNSLDNPFTSQ